MFRNENTPSSQYLTVIDKKVPESVQDAVTEELGATSAPLLSAAFFINSACQTFNEDFILCKHINGNKGAEECLLEGKRVTRCARSLLESLKAHCFDEFLAHYKCLQNRNYQLQDCRSAERALNSCGAAKLNLTKTVPGAEKEFVWKKKKPIYRPNWEDAEGAKLDYQWKNRQQ